MSANETIHRRPAEVSGLVGAVTLLLVHLLGVDDPDVIVALGVIVGAVPAIVTWSVGLVRRRNGQADA